MSSRTHDKLASYMICCLADAPCTRPFWSCTAVVANSSRNQHLCFAKASVPPRGLRDSCERTIYRGILKRGPIYQVQCFGVYSGVRRSLEDALQLALASHPHVNREDLLWDRSLSMSAGASTAAAAMQPQRQDSMSSVSSVGSDSRPGTMPATPEVIAQDVRSLSADQFVQLFGSLWAVYGAAPDELQPSDLTDMIARMHGPDAGPTCTCTQHHVRRRLTVVVCAPLVPTTARTTGRALPVRSGGRVLLRGWAEVWPGARRTRTGRGGAGPCQAASVGALDACCPPPSVAGNSGDDGRGLVVVMGCPLAAVRIERFALCLCRCVYSPGRVFDMPRLPMWARTQCSTAVLCSSSSAWVLFARRRMTSLGLDCGLASKATT